MFAMHVLTVFHMYPSFPGPATPFHKKTNAIQVGLREKQQGPIQYAINTMSSKVLVSSLPHLSL